MISPMDYGISEYSLITHIGVINYVNGVRIINIGGVQILVLCYRNILTEAGIMKTIVATMNFFIFILI